LKQIKALSAELFQSETCNGVSTVILISGPFEDPSPCTASAGNLYYSFDRNGLLIPAAELTFVLSFTGLLLFCLFAGFSLASLLSMLDSVAHLLLPIVSDGGNVN
jgi:hypothetical protein